MRLLEGVISAASFDPDARAHISRMSDASDQSLIHDINALVVSLKNYGVWDKLDDLCVHHLNQADSLLGLKGDFDSTYQLDGAAVSGWSIGTGFRCDLQSSGNTRYINTNINDTVSNHLADDDMSLFAYRSDYSVASMSSFCGGDMNSGPDIGQTAIKDDGRFWGGNGTIGSADVVTSALTTGFLGGTRRSSNDVEIRNGANSNTAVTASTNGASPIDIFVGCVNFSGTPFLSSGASSYHTVSGWGVGSGLTSQELSDLRDALDTYMASRSVI